MLPMWRRIRSGEVDGHQHRVSYWRGFVGLRIIQRVMQAPAFLARQSAADDQLLPEKASNASFKRGVSPFSSCLLTE